MARNSNATAAQQAQTPVVDEDDDLDIPSGNNSDVATIDDSVFEEIDLTNVKPPHRGAVAGGEYDLIVTKCVNDQGKTDPATGRPTPIKSLTFRVASRADGNDEFDGAYVYDRLYFSKAAMPFTKEKLLALGFDRVVPGFNDAVIGARVRATVKLVEFTYERDSGSHKKGDKGARNDISSYQPASSAVSVDDLLDE